MERRPGWERGCVRSGSGNGFKPKRIFVNIVDAGAVVPDVPEFILIDGDESAGDGNSSDDDSGDESLIEEEGGGAGAGDELVEL